MQETKFLIVKEYSLLQKFYALGKNFKKMRKAIFYYCLKYRGSTLFESTILSKSTLDLLDNYLFIYCRVIKTARFHGDYVLPKKGEVAIVTLFTDRCGFPSLPLFVRVGT